MVNPLAPRGRELERGVNRFSFSHVDGNLKYVRVVDIVKSYADRVLFANLSFDIGDRDRSR